MVYYITKIALTTGLIVLISELAKRSSFIGALLASIPLVSVLAMCWLYVETKDVERVGALSKSVFWLVLPSLAFFISLPVFLKKGFHFSHSMGGAIGITIACYWLMVTVLRHYGIEL